MPSRARVIDDGAGERMLACRFGRGHASEELTAIDTDRDVDALNARLALGERSGLVDEERRDLRERLERVGVLDQDTGVRARSGRDEDRHRRREAERAGARDDEDAHGGDERVGEARLGTDDEPRDERHRRGRDDGGDEDGAHAIDQSLNARPCPGRLGDHRDDA